MVENIIGVDVFAGVGGMSFGAVKAEIDVKLAVEKDKHAAETYILNHPDTRVIVDDIKNIKKNHLPEKNGITILFGGPPCQGFSTSNQRTRNKDNKENWLLKEFIRIVSLWRPDWVVFENVKGIVNTAGGMFVDYIINELSKLGYYSSSGILDAAEFGVPQSRSRFFIIASQNKLSINLPQPIQKIPITVREAIEDLPKLKNDLFVDYLPYSTKPISAYAKKMRNGQIGCFNNLVTKNSVYVVERYKHIPQGGNWRNIPEKLMDNYKDISQCHTGIYKRLQEDEPSVVLGNYRKNMLIHPWEHRGLSVREAARLQSFPDSFIFKGSIGYQQQQVGNAVPPLLAKAIFKSIILSTNH